MKNFNIMGVHKKPVYLKRGGIAWKGVLGLFVDAEKAFDRVPRKVLWWRKLGVGGWVMTEQCTVMLSPVYRWMALLVNLSKCQMVCPRDLYWVSCCSLLCWKPYQESLESVGITICRRSCNLKWLPCRSYKQTCSLEDFTWITWLTCKCQQNQNPGLQCRTYQNFSEESKVSLWCMYLWCWC